MGGDALAGMWGGIFHGGMSEIFFGVPGTFVRGKFSGREYFFPGEMSVEMSGGGCPGCVYTDPHAK